MKATVRFTRRAAKQAAEVSVWWHSNRPAAPDLFDIEFEAATALLATTPDVGSRYHHDGIPGLRRISLRRSRYHLYYAHDSDLHEVIIVAVWSALRGTGPLRTDP